LLKTVDLLLILAVVLIICNMPIYEVFAASTDKEVAIEDEYAIRFMEAIKDRDTDSLLELWVGEDSEQLQESFYELYDYWDGKEITSYKKIGEEYRPGNEKKKRPSGMEYEYEIISGSEIVRLKFSITDEYNGGRYIDSYQFSNKVQSSEIIETTKKLKPEKVIMMILMVIEVIFSLAMFILCVKEKPKFWILWGIAILLIYGGIAIELKQKITVGIFCYLLYFPKIFFTSNGFILRLSFPLGAFAYFFVRKNVLKFRV